ncbi:MAG TPA: hypothetical protein GXZ27_05920 [Thermoanaerobacterales bacterium]|nr:hypothetical protein [Thermoanaerobacterales bacterium]
MGNLLLTQQSETKAGKRKQIFLMLQKAPYIVKSSIQLTKGENNTYTATLAELPEDDLSFTLYAHEKITLFDKTFGKIQQKLGYVVFFAMNAIPFLIIGIIIVMLAIRRKKGKYI